MDKYIREITDIAYHRNGVSGVPFVVSIFISKEGNRMVGICFDDDTDHYCAVLDIDLLYAGNIKFTENSWRGDNFEPELKAVWEQKEG